VKTAFAAWALGALSLWVLGAASAAQADPPDRDACIKAYVDAQGARKAGELLRAEQGLAVCANDVCPGMVKRDCTQWLEEVTRALPSVILIARDDRGGDLLDVATTVDGQRVPLDGKPLPLDPGKHSMHFEHAGAPPRDQVVLLAEGEHARPVIATFPSVIDVRVRAEGSRRVPAASWALGGVGGVAAGVFTYFAVRGTNDRVSLGCERGCSEANYSRVDGEFTAADVALGISVASLGTAVVVWLVTHRQPPVQAQGTRGGLRLFVSF
jgi:hypothetical protein